MKLQKINITSKKDLDDDIFSLQVIIYVSKGLHQNQKIYNCTYLQTRRLI